MMSRVLDQITPPPVSNILTTDMLILWDGVVDLATVSSSNAFQNSFGSALRTNDSLNARLKIARARLFNIGVVKEHSHENKESRKLRRSLPARL